MNSMYSAAVPEGVHASREAQPAERRVGASVRRYCLAIRWLQRIAGEQVLDVGEQQFLVLLFVMNPERGAGSDLFCIGVVWRFEQHAHVLIHIVPVFPDLFQRGPGQQAALKPRVELAHAFVVGIEKEAEAGMKRTVLR